MGRRLTLAVALVALLQMHTGAVRGDEKDPRETVSRAKAATALILDGQRFAGTAFCVEAKGWFVSNRNAFGRKEACRGTSRAD